MLTRWQKALQLPGVRGLVAGRKRQYPSAGDVDTTLSLL
jgi:hypothetical protein